ncbi:MAG: hypothetical protein JW966_02745 [Anaerolineae bacterium]|nr:hypothetical protein [Anaerolineae bacterium]
MADLINKLNTLIRASVNDALSFDSERRLPGDKRPRRPRLGKDIDREIAALRERINDAVAHEDQITTDIQALQRVITDWDQQANQALVDGKEATARHAVRQMQIKQRELAMSEADLAQHQLATTELIRRVNELEAIVAEARQQDQARSHDQARSRDEVDDTDSLSARLRNARQQIETDQPLSGRRTAQPPKTDTSTVDEADIDDDLAQRRARLSQ